MKKCIYEAMDCERWWWCCLFHLCGKKFLGKNGKAILYYVTFFLQKWVESCFVWEFFYVIIHILNTHSIIMQFAKLHVILLATNSIIAYKLQQIFCLIKIFIICPGGAVTVYTTTVLEVSYSGRSKYFYDLQMMVSVFGLYM